MPFLSIVDMVVKYQVVVWVLGTGTCDLKKPLKWISSEPQYADRLMKEGARQLLTNRLRHEWEDKFFLGSTLHPGEEEAE